MDATLEDLMFGWGRATDLAIWTRQERARGEREEGRLWYRSKNSCRVAYSRKAGRQAVGIWTVQRSSEDSSVEVPMKSNVRQLWASLSSWVIKPCWAESLKSRLFLFSRANKNKI